MTEDDDDDDDKDEDLEQERSVSDDPSRELLIEEYKRLTEEIGRRGSESANLERYTVLGISAYYGWVLSEPSHSSLPFVWMPPVIVVILCLIRSVAHGNAISTIAAYLVQTEGKFCVNGYETRLNNARSKSRTLRLILFFGGSSIFVWVPLLIITVGLALWRPHPVLAREAMEDGGVIFIPNHNRFDSNYWPPLS